MAGRVSEERGRRVPSTEYRVRKTKYKVQRVCESASTAVSWRSVLCTRYFVLTLPCSPSPVLPRSLPPAPCLGSNTSRRRSSIFTFTFRDATARGPGSSGLAFGRKARNATQMRCFLRPDAQGQDRQSRGGVARERGGSAWKREMLPRLPRGARRRKIEPGGSSQ